jgi:pumilio family protein 6
LHKEATRVVADAYELYANAAQRALLLRDFYGKEVALFEPKVDGPSGLKRVLEYAKVEKRKRILGAVKENLSLMYVL